MQYVSVRAGLAYLYLFVSLIFGEHYSSITEMQIGESIRDWVWTARMKSWHAYDGGMLFFAFFFCALESYQYLHPTFNYRHSLDGAHWLC